MKYFVLLALPLWFLTSCSQQPSCDSEDVKELVFEILKEKKHEALWQKVYSSNIIDNKSNAVKKYERKYQGEFVKNNFTENVDYVIDNKSRWNKTRSNVIGGWVVTNVRIDDEYYYAFGKKSAQKIRDFKNSEEYLAQKNEVIKFAEEVTRKFADSIVLNTVYNLKLTAIRLVSVQESVKKCNCSAELITNGKKSYTIEYSAQYTEDGQFFVKVGYIPYPNGY